MITANLGSRAVHVGGILLDPARSQKLFNHSPDGFAWGYAGSGPSQLALALLLHFTDNEAWSLSHYQDFKFDVVAHWDQHHDINLPNRAVSDWVRAHDGKVRDDITV